MEEHFLQLVEEVEKLNIIFFNLEFFFELKLIYLG